MLYNRARFLLETHLKDYIDILHFIRKLYDEPKDFIPLHQPYFIGNEKRYLEECIDTGFVSSVGAFVDRFERDIADFCGSAYAIATTNGTSALHIALHALGVDSSCEVITQPLSFIATSNAISYTGARPIYIDVDMDTLSLSPSALRIFLETFGIQKEGKLINKHSGKTIKACVPMHTFGHPGRIQEISAICEEWGIALIEDSAESLGSYLIDENLQTDTLAAHTAKVQNIAQKSTQSIASNLRHTGTFGVCGILSFNGNKTITCGGGGAILTQDSALAKRLKHLTTTAKIPHPYEYNHDELGFNYRLPNINAALACAQIELLPKFLNEKAEIAQMYAEFFASYTGVEFIGARAGTKPNFWLNAIKLESKHERDRFLELSNANGVMTRPIWKLNNECPMYQSAQSDSLKNAKILRDCIINLPSSARIHIIKPCNA